MYLYNLYSKLELCESNTLNSWLKLSNLVFLNLPKITEWSCPAPRHGRSKHVSLKLMIEIRISVVQDQEIPSKEKRYFPKFQFKTCAFPRSTAKNIITYQCINCINIFCMYDCMMYFTYRSSYFRVCTFRMHIHRNMSEWRQRVIITRSVV